MTTSTLEGVAALTKQLQALGKLEDGNALRRAVRAGIKPALTRAREIIPTGTQAHRLYNHLLVAPGYAKSVLRTISTINGDKTIASGLLGVRKGAYYAVKFLEFGTRKMGAQPWLRRALLESRDQCESSLRDSLRASVEKAAK